jgi:hypothetical protein
VKTSIIRWSCVVASIVATLALGAAAPTHADGGPAMAAVTFTGSAAAPTVTITGSGFGSAPASTGPAYPGFTGDNYGTALYIADASSSPVPWTAGNTSIDDYVGLVLDSYGDTQVAYSFGTSYTDNEFRLNQGDSFTVYVKGVQCSGTIDYNGPAVSCAGPTIAVGSMTTADGHAYSPGTWTNQNVTVVFTCTDTSGGGPATSTPQTVSTEGADQAVTGTCTDLAGNSASTTVSGIDIDKTAPTLSPSVSPDPVVLHGSASAAAGASDLLSGVASLRCGAVNTNTVGVQTLTCTATDEAGNTATQSVNYTVVYNLCLLYDKTVNPGATLHVKLELCDAYGDDVSSSSVAVTAQSVTQGTTVVEQPASSFRFASSLGSAGGYTFDLSTKGLGPGTYSLNVTVAGDPTVHAAQFVVS